MPDFVPLPTDTTVRYSGVAELAIGTALILGPKASQRALGRFAAAFFAAVFPGNLSQWLHRRNAFGLDTDGKRLARLFFQPVLIYWALKSTEPPPVSQPLRVVPNVDYQRYAGTWFEIARLPTGSSAGARVM